ncbi:nucleotidyltransferase [Metabacillus iocasae]|uniref:tRNA(Met) cytidine acetate ligase n=1 Tax=Priestia iocasae TaxID=2291674 RepID=A0ABS2QQN0_9BACI|nr:nucleotidyltransferase [Metabacillus iocasae]MBM7701754.1 putative nucleotidyltransferase [Metabacillus iocasae]
MQAAGIIVEYNPFHNGHYYHMNEAKKQTHSDCIVAVMSGHFLQRGEPALISKWTRTAMALKGGADLVIELPYAFSTQQADTFAKGAVSILQALHVEALCFGSENGHIDEFIQTASFSQQHKSELSLLIKKAMQQGFSYPKASSLALQTILQEKEVSLNLSQPNNILGLSYVKAINNLHASIKPHTITRIQSQYHDTELSDTSIASATSIRKALFSGSKCITDIANHVPHFTLSLLQEYVQTYGCFHDWENYFSFLKYKLLTMTPNQLQEVYEVEEGIEYRLLDYIKEAPSFYSFIEKVKTKRYTWSRLQRICTHILTHTTKEQMAFTHDSVAPYIRVLGMSQLGRTYLKNVKKKVDIPIVSTVSKSNIPSIALDIKATNSYSMILQEPHRTELMLKEYNTPPILYS